MVTTKNGAQAVPAKSRQQLWEEWRDRAVVPRDVARERMRDGWTPEAAFTTPAIVGAPDPLPTAIAYIKANGPAPLAVITAAINCGSLHYVGRTLRTAVREGKMHTTPRRSAVGGTVKDYHVGKAPRPTAETTGGPPWINPIRARALGLTGAR